MYRVGRRSLLRTSVVAATGAIAGCVGDIKDDRAGGDEDGNSGPTGGEDAASSDADPSDGDDVPSTSTWRARGDPVDVEREIDGDEYETTDPEAICAIEAADAAEAAVETEFGGSIDSVFGAASYGGTYDVTVTMLTTLNRDGDVVSGPDVEIDEVADAAPAEVSVTVIVDGESHKCTHSVAVVHEIERLE